MTLTLECAQSVDPEARALMGALATVAPTATRNTPPTIQTRDPATILVAATLVLTVPGAILATLEIKDRLERREIKRTLEALKEKLAEADGSAHLTFPSGASVDLAHTSTDAAVDLMIRELGGVK
ncbi:hypothetical protein [uncultured Tateyamaria sp.]|uniref:hypothetical protein n=1 Tax=uncultured Tateyamaria sp. TaxID=455651 RepID=UPI002638A444|nr:hypothetical protein [uncultured Tateyamaria sp.]